MAAPALTVVQFVLSGRQPSEGIECAGCEEVTGQSSYADFAIVFAGKTQGPSASPLAWRSLRMTVGPRVCVLHSRRSRAPSVLSSAKLKRIAGLMFSDLEAQEIPDCLTGLGIGGADHDSSSGVCELHLVEHLLAQFLHDVDAGRRLIVNKHWDIEVTRTKGTGYVFEMHSDLIDAGFVVGRVGGDLNHSTIFCQQKMVSDLLLVKAHALIAALFKGLVGG